MAAEHTIPIDDIKAAGLGFERATILHGSTWRDASTVIVVPTRGTVPWRVVQSWQGMLTPMNQKRHWVYAAGFEVGEAYNAVIKSILENEELKKWKYILTLEDDNLIPPDAHQRLIESIEEGGWDAVSGIYWTKGPFNMPMAYGDPEHYQRTGKLDFAPRDVREALNRGQIMPVNGIAMGCALWRIDLFRRIPAPWFVTVSDVVTEAMATEIHAEAQGPQSWTQDLWFCRRAVQAGARFACDMRVRVGHIDVNDGTVY